jgi:hypothetical protein
MALAGFTIGKSPLVLRRIDVEFTRARSRARPGLA